jgi:hypothetical protein
MIRKLPDAVPANPPTNSASEYRARLEETARNMRIEEDIFRALKMSDESPKM